MAWNKQTSILGILKDEAATKQAVYAEANTIFTATFIGMVIDRGRQGYRVDMEPDMDGADADARTKKDREAMLKHNDVCAKVNHIVRAYRPLQEDKRGIHWGLTPEFSRGGMISGGDDALNAYAGYDKAMLESAWKLLTVETYSGEGENKGIHTVYVGRGAYCGLVVVDGQAVAAMSTLRTAISSTDVDDQLPSGTRWLPPENSGVFKGRLTPKDANDPIEDPTFCWGMIGNVNELAVVSDKVATLKEGRSFSAVQNELRAEGMKFFPRSGDPGPGSNVIGYTHGLVRAIYECERIGQGNPYEMSLGKDTAKLASCMSCSLFMIANGYTPSASHLGSGESWLPLYHGKQHRYSPLEALSARSAKAKLDDLMMFGDAAKKQRRSGGSGGIDVSEELLGGLKYGEKIKGKFSAKLNVVVSEQSDDRLNAAMDIAETLIHKEARKDDLRVAINDCNKRWAWKIAAWMMTGVQAMQSQEDWVADPECLKRLAEKLKGITLWPKPEACANLYLDAMTCHVKDLERLDEALKFGASPQSGSEHKEGHALADWLVGEWRAHPWMKYGWRQFRTPFSNDDIAAFRRLPTPLQK